MIVARIYHFGDTDFVRRYQAEFRRLGFDSPSGIVQNYYSAANAMRNVITDDLHNYRIHGRHDGPVDLHDAPTYGSRPGGHSSDESGYSS